METPTSCAQDVNAGANGSQSGQPSQPSERPTSFPAGLLVVRYPGSLSQEHAARLIQHLEPMAETLNLNAMVLDAGADAHIQTDNTALISAMGAQVEAINRLAASNEALVQAMAEVDEEGAEPAPSGTYMDGSPKR